MASRGRPPLSPAAKLISQNRTKERRYQRMRELHCVRFSEDVWVRWKRMQREENLNTNDAVGDVLLALWESTHAKCDSLSGHSTSSSDSGEETESLISNISESNGGSGSKRRRTDDYDDIKLYKCIATQTIIKAISEIDPGQPSEMDGHVPGQQNARDGVSHRGRRIARDVGVIDPGKQNSRGGHVINPGSVIDHEQQNAGEGTAQTERKIVLVKCAEGITQMKDSVAEDTSETMQTDNPTTSPVVIEGYKVFKENEDEPGTELAVKEEPVDLDYESKTNTKMGSFICEVCGKELSSPSSLSRHRQCHQEKTLKCPMCDRQFNLNATLKQHLITHSSEAENTCAKCGKQFKHRQSLRRHMEGHSDDKSRVQRPLKKQRCNNCGREFLHIRRHIGVCKEDRQRTFTCAYCGRKFLEQRYLNEHVRCVHLFEARYSCSICNGKFQYRASLLNHKRRHH